MNTTPMPPVPTGLGQIPTTPAMVKMCEQMVAQVKNVPAMLTFTSSHHRPDRVYRVTNVGDRNHPATCEYLRDGEWREANSPQTRHLGYCLAHGSVHVSLSLRGAARIKTMAIAATRGSEPAA